MPEGFKRLQKLNKEFSLMGFQILGVDAPSEYKKAADLMKEMAEALSECACTDKQQDVMNKWIDWK